MGKLQLRKENDPAFQVSGPGYFWSERAYPSRLGVFPLELWPGEKSVYFLKRNSHHALSTQVLLQTPQQVHTEEALSHFAWQMEQKNIQPVLRVPAEATVRADRSALVNQVLGNLISNSIKFSHQGSVLKISYRESINEFILPDLTRIQAETILKATAFRSFHSYYSQENKTGLLNSYKAFKVVQRLRDRCGFDAACVDTEIQKKETYRFEVSSPDEKIRGICKSREILPQEQMKELRRQQLLGDDPVYSRLLGCAYRNEGYSINADFYFNLWMMQKAPQRLQQKIQKLAVEAIERGNYQSAALRDPSVLNEEYRAALSKSQDYTAKVLLEAYDRSKRITVRP